VAGLPVGALQPPFLATPDRAGGLAGRDRFAVAAALADPGRNPALAQGLFERGRVVAAVGPEFVRAKATREQPVDKRQQMPLLVLVACGQPYLQRRPVRVDG
jgi:hypothetical protein